MFDRLFSFTQPAPPRTDSLQIGALKLPLRYVPHPRAKRYRLRLQPDGVARITVPRRGSVAAAREFAVKNIGWLEQQLQRQASQPKIACCWPSGTEIYYRGELVRIELVNEKLIQLGEELIHGHQFTGDLRPAVQKYLWQLAQRELPTRVRQLADSHGISITRITIRNQKTRWGSCSRRGTISLNWRLIQCPALVADYIILHELAHRRHMNHSEKFWHEVAQLCPGYRAAEAWVKQHACLLR